VDRPTTSESFEAEAISIPRARHFVGRAIGDWSDDEQRSDVLLLVTELASNAVQHGRTPFDVTVELHPDGVTVAVSDGNPRMPQPCMVPDDAWSGKGLVLMDSLATRWGSERRTGGKVVWFTLSTAQASAGPNGERALSS
jgi:anti-sigma regulatory factor (Ser/Thr protein kinase)